MGVWQTARRDEAFVYDGCTVRFSDTLQGEPAIFPGRRNIAHAFVVDVRDYADPFPYFRARARWDGEVLQAVSILGLKHLGTWREGRFWRQHPWRPFFRAEREEELGHLASALVLVDRIMPKEEELAAERGVEMPPPDEPDQDFIPSIMCPTGDCEWEYE